MPAALRNLCTLLVLCSVAATVAKAQDLAGTWEGGGAGTLVTIVLVKNGDSYVGHTYDRDGMGFCRTNFEATFNTSDKKFKGRSKGFIDHSFLHSQTNYNLTYSATGSREVLKGHVYAKSATMKILSFGIPMGVSLTKISNRTDTTAYMLAALTGLPVPQEQPATFAAANSGQMPPIASGNATPTPAQNDTAALIAAKHNRQSTVIQTITTPERILQVTMYDNGVEDGDSISILYNDRVIKNNIPVTTRPVVFGLMLDEKATSHALTLIAHNLGTIAPNTAMIEIKAGAKSYQVSASSTLGSNAIINILYEP